MFLFEKNLIGIKLNSYTHIYVCTESSIRLGYILYNSIRGYMELRFERIALRVILV